MKNMTKIDTKIEQHPNVIYAREELHRLVRRSDDRGKQEQLNWRILELIKLLVKQGDDGQATFYKINIAERLISCKPLSPLIGISSEWSEPQTTEDGHRVYQNKRCPSVFKVEDKDGRVVDQYDTDAIVCSDDGGMNWFTTPKFVRKIQFPYAVPKAPEEVYVKDVDGVYQLVEDPTEIKKMYDAAVARKKILEGSENLHD